MKRTDQFIAIAILSFALPVCAAEPFTPNHVARLRYVAAAEMSPDGKHVAYVLSVPRRPFVEDDGPAWSELHVVDDQGNSRPYVTGKSNVSAIAWKPDGSAISFLDKRDGDKHRALYAIPLRGGEASKILDHDTDIADYSWSPDGKRIAFTATEKQPEDAKKLKDKGFNQEVYEEKLESNRIWIAEPQSVDAWDDADDDDKPTKFELPGHATGVTWSPTGKHLAAAVAPTPLIDDFYMKRKIHVIDAGDGSPVGVIENPGKLGVYRWSPDGRHIALLAGADIHDPNAGRLMVAPHTGGKPVDVLPDLADGDATSLGWRDAEQIVFLAGRGGTASLGSVPLDGEDRRTAIPFGKHSLADLTLSSDGNHAAVIGDSPAHPPEVFLVERGTQLKQLTNNNPWLADVELAKQEVVTYKARDGLELEGLLIRPLNEQPGERYPLVMIVHGGPEAHFRNGWMTSYSRPGQLLAANGFAVFYPNYRGSTGRGVEFSKRGQSDYAGGEFDDVIDAIDHLAEAGLVDKDKVGVTGGSYGGYASAWLATRHTDRFAASVMFVGISDLISKFGTTDIPNEMLLVHARKQPWDDWAFYKERSPITYAEQARTPILIMHGKNDPRVHPSQSMELYRYLKTLGNVPVRLVFYEGEGHGNRKAAARLDYSMRLLRWMQHYLQGSGGDPPPADLDYTAVKPAEDETPDDEDGSK